MSLAELPLFFALTGVAMYAVLAGADFGAGIWQLLAGRGEPGKHIRNHAHHSMSPVWEANHVWLIFVLVVLWTAYPMAFSSMASTLAIALAVAGLGIILRGTAYALHSGTNNDAETRVVDTVVAVGSLMTPFALAAAAGGIASQRVPVGNAAGDLFASWLNPTSIMMGILAILSSAYLAAVYLAADARRGGDPALVESFRRRALIVGVLAGAQAIASGIVLRADARSLFDGMVSMPAVLSAGASIVAGSATIALVARRRLDGARVTAAIAVTGIIGAWALAQNPILLPGLTVQQAAAPDSALIPLVIAIVAGGCVLFPSIAVLFRLALGGTFNSTAQRTQPASHASTPTRARRIATGRAAAGMLAIGAPLLVIGEADWAHAVGVITLGAFVVLAFCAIDPGADHEDTTETLTSK
jgi:cytochrome d ubiquinol oxidase subunit II